MITPDGYRILQQYIKPGMYIIELGDQFADWSGQVHGERADMVLRELHDVLVTSIDIHGKNRALPYDLNEHPCDPWNNYADIVTDFGTMEHTDDIYNCLKNVWKWCTILKPIGISIHANPDQSYTKHGNYYFTPAFWETYCKITGAKLLHMETTPVYRKDNPHHELYAVVQHSDVFMNREQWDAEMKNHYHRWE